jgi:outer membrane protein assembly factor BamB
MASARTFLLALLGAALLAVPQSGCQSGNRGDGDLQSALDKKLLVGPTLANKLGFRCMWQQKTPLDGSTKVKDVFFVERDIIVVDSDNRLTMLRLSDGSQVWHSAPMPRQEEILSMSKVRVNGANCVVAATDTDAFILDANTGSMITRQDMPNAPITGVATLGPELIFGGADGRIVFHNAKLGYELRANSLNGQIGATPVVADDEVVGVSTVGEVMLLEGKSASRLWVRTLTGSITAEPAVTRDGIYVATLGQSLWCLDRNNGSVKWKYFTESPLKVGPTALGDRIFQYVPSEGLLCLEADPRDSPRGKVLWTNSEVDGAVTTAIRNDLVLWNADDRRIQLVDADRGDVKVTTRLPKVKDLFTFRDGNNDLVIITTSPEGDVQRLGSR